MRSAAALVLVFALVVAAGACSDDGDPLVEASRNAVNDDARVATSLAAGQTYADVAASLLESTKRCTADHDRADARCTARASAAAFFRVLSDEVVACDAAGRRRARESARRAIATVVAADRDDGEKAAAPPPALPRC